MATKTRRQDDVYIAELKDGGTRLDPPKRLTFSDSKDYVNAWTRDGKAVLFESNRTGSFQIFQQKLDNNTAQPLIQGPDDEHNATPSPDGKWVLYWAASHDESPPRSYRLMRSPVSGGPSEQILEVPADASLGWDCPQRSDRFCVLSRKEQDHVAFYEVDPVRGLGKEVAKVQWPARNFSVSPDGTHLAVELQDAVRTIDLRSGNEHNLPNAWTLFSLAWARDGKTVYAAAQSNDYILVRFEMDGKTRVLLDRGRNQWISNLSLSPNGHSLAFSQQTFDSNAWLLQNF